MVLQTILFLRKAPSQNFCELDSGEDVLILHFRAFIFLFHSNKVVDEWQSAEDTNDVRFEDENDKLLESTELTIYFWMCFLNSFRICSIF